MVAITIIGIVLIAMLSTITNSLLYVSFARQRQAATSLADRTMEEVRALPFAMVANGLDPSNDPTWSTDTNITSTTSGGVTTYFYAGKEIPTSSGTSVAPFVPHRQTVAIGPTTYTVSVYPTYEQTTPVTVYLVTVLVSWAHPAKGGLADSLTTQSLVYSPAGCLSTATHPFAAPCEPFLYANSTDVGGHVTVTPASSTVPAIQGIALDHASISPAEAASTAQIEQVSAVHSLAQTSGASLLLTGGTLQTVGGSQASASANSDPASSSSYQSVSTAPQSSASLSGTGTGSNDTLTVSTGGPDPAQASATISASTNPPNYCADPSGTYETTQEPCGSSSATQSQATSINADLWGNSSLDLGNTLLSSIGSGSGQTFATRHLSAGGTYCTQTSGDGCVHVSTTRALGTVQLAGLPGNLSSSDVPAGWSGYLVQLRGFSDSLSAEAGVGTVAPTVNASGTISYWNGAGYTNLLVAPGGPENLPVASVSISDPNYDNTGIALVITITPQLTTGGTVISDPAGSGCASPCTRAQASATSASPILGNIAYSVTYGGTSVADLNIGVDLGTIGANATYTAAPSA
ncbi:MAG TPA: hypothetical protein VNF50_05510 [Acidimicrobiales bacterium]|nr:hypothetical protein [Acidimicrobiales bacterium]